MKDGGVQDYEERDAAKRFRFGTLSQEVLEVRKN
jgi:hypothetical protein